MIYDILRILILGAFSFNIIYGFIIVSKNKEIKPIFKVSIIAMISFFIARLFFFILNLSEGNDRAFSLGVLGQVTGYLFLTLCNKAYLPFETEKQKISIPALLILLIPLASYLFAIIIARNIDSIVCLVLYLASTGLSIYYSFKNIFNSKYDSRFKSLLGFNICISIMALASSLNEAVIVVENETLNIVLATIITVISVVSIVLSLPLLNKGVGENYDN